MKLSRCLPVMLFLGCASHAAPYVQQVVYHTHMVRLSPTYLSWQDERGFGCGNIYDHGNGMYEANTVNWGAIASGSTERATGYFTNFSDAVKFIEQWCKP